METEMIGVNATARDWPYRDLATPLTGVLFRDESMPARQPGILLVHGGAGLDEHAREQAHRYASLGYTVFACDMLGDGVAGDRDRVIKCLTELRDNPGLMVRRAQAALGELSRCPGVHFLEVRQSNSAARRLYEGLGFQAVGERPAYYDDPPETGIVMRILS